MNNIEYQEEINKLDEYYKNKKLKISKQYCESQIKDKNVSIGDVIIDNIGRKSKIIKYKIYFTSNGPVPLLVCEWIKNDGTKRVRYEEIEIFIPGIKEIL